MEKRWTTIAVAAFGLWSATAGVASGDWAVRRRSSGLVDQGARALAARPEDDLLAARLWRGLGRTDQEALLARFESQAERQPGDFFSQLAYAQLLLAAGRWNDAAARFENAASLTADSVAARWGQARALGRGGDARGARVVLRAAIPLARGQAQVRRLAGELLSAAVAAGDVDSEIEARGAWARVEPSNKKVVFDFASSLARAGRPGEAADVLAGASVQDGRSGTERARWALAEGHHRSDAGSLGAAADAVERALRLAPTVNFDLRREIWGLAIDVARRRGTLDELRLSLAHPRDRIEWEALAGICEGRGDLPGARSALDQAVALAPGDLDLRRRRITVVKRIGRTNDVVGLYEQMAVAAARVGGDAFDAIADCVEELWRLGQGVSAGRIFDRALASRWGGVPLWRRLAEVAGRWADDGRAVQAWTMVLRRTPTDEVAIVALGEARFERGQRRMAVDVWRTLLGRGHVSAGARCRLGELLIEHDLDQDALAEARIALAEAPGDVGPHRLMALIFERQQRLHDAEDEWQVVLRLAPGAAGASARREARARLAGLWVRQGSARVDERLGMLQENLRQGGRDRDTLTFLVEVQLRIGRTDDAIAALKSFLSTEDESVSGADETADLILRLVRTLRQVRRVDEATWWLEEMARRWPGRSRDAFLQVADIALAGHADARALAFAERAAVVAPDDARVLLRVAAVDERLGRLDDALAIYRRVVKQGGDPAGLLALAALLTRQGDVEEQRGLLREVLRVGTDEDLVTEAGRRAIAIEEAAGTLESLESFVAELPEVHPLTAAGSSRSRVLVSLLARLVPPAYRAQGHDAAAQAMMERLARHGSRALIDLIRAPDAAPDIGAVELVGMLGRSEAVPALALLIAPDVDPGGRPAAPRTVATSNHDDMTNAVVIALGRLGGDQARAALEALAPRPALRLSLLWALGRVGGPDAIARAREEIARGAPDAVIVACLSLGRAGGPEVGPLLLSVAGEQGRPGLIRRAAIWGLALGKHVEATGGLLDLLDSGDRGVSLAAATAVGMIGAALAREPKGRLVDALARRIALADRGAEEGIGGKLSALAQLDQARRWLVAAGPATAPAVDEAGSIAGVRISPEALLSGLEASARAGWDRVVEGTGAPVTSPGNGAGGTPGAPEGIATAIAGSTWLLRGLAGDEGRDARQPARRAWSRSKSCGSDRLSP